MANPQKENGYTAIANEILEQLVKANLNGTEMSIVLYVLRKTYGYQKKQDAISYSQFLNIIPVTRPTLWKSLKILQLVKIIKLVKRGDSKKASNLYAFNKNYDEWQLVKKTKLVNFRTTQLVKKSKPTKENIQKKDTTKNKVSYQLMEKFKEITGLENPDGDYQKDNLFQTRYTVKKIKEQIKKQENIEADDERVLLAFEWILTKMDSFHKNNATNILYINRNFNKIINSIK